MSNKYHTKNGRTSRRGTFINGIWHCDCDPRLPAEKFQTKNGGKNHGRWFYTCQKSQPKRCGFFLWTDEAKTREESAVLSNSLSEPPAPTTPKKPARLIQTSITTARPKTPSPGSKRLSYPASDKTLDFEPEAERFDWSSSADEELAEVVTAYETPRKAARTAQFNTPGKRGSSEMLDTINILETSCKLSDDVFATPATGDKSIATGLLSPAVTPAKRQSRIGEQVPFHSGPDPSALTKEVLDILRPANLSAAIEKDLVDLLNKHELRTQGIVKGREITRLAVQAKEKKIVELQARIAGLEAEKETSRTVVAHLKRDIATSPRKGGGRGRVQPTRSEV